MLVRLVRREERKGEITYYLRFCKSTLRTAQLKSGILFKQSDTRSVLRGFTRDCFDWQKYYAKL